MNYDQEEIPSSVNEIEAVRIAACLNEAVVKMAFLNTLTPDVLAHRDELANLVGDEITTLINEQKALEKQFEVLVQQQHALRNASNTSEMKAINKQIEEVSSKLKEKTTVLCRNLKDSPNISENILKIQTERAAIQSLIQRTIKDLNDLSYPTMAKSVGEEKEQYDKLTMAEENERKAAAEIAALKQQIAQTKAKYDKLDTLLQVSVGNKREDLKKLRASDPEVRVAEPEAAARLEAKKRINTAEENELEEQNELLRQKIETEKRIHDEFFNFLNTQDQEMKKLMTKWLLKSERDTEEINFKNNQVNQKINATEKVLDDLQGQELQKRIREEDRIETRKQEKETREVEKKVRAARREVGVLEIQHWIWEKKYAEEAAR
ncbi:MAG: putative IQ motif, EF-hand binding site, partial [Streblomastix strix]